jgi:hypothetical protein
MALQSFVGAWPLFQFIEVFTKLVGLLGRGSARRKAAICTQDSTQTQTKDTHTSMPRVGFDPTIPAFERGKTFLALDRTATLICTKVAT